MKFLDTLPQKLGSTETWVEKGGVRCLSPGILTVRELCMEMNACHARFVTITAYQLPKEEGMRLEYHWDLAGTLLGFPFILRGDSPEGLKIESIYDLAEAADWIEREIHEEYEIEFTGRVYEPLLMRAGDQLGVNLREMSNICKVEPEPGNKRPKNEL